MSEREAVITGMGLITPVGEDVKKNSENLMAMKTGIAQHLSEADSYMNKTFHYFGRVPQLESNSDMPRKLLSQMKFLNRGSLLGFTAAREALSQSGLDISVIPRSRRALYIASGDFTKIGYDFMYPATKDGTGNRWQEMDFERLNNSALNKVNPFFLLESINNNLFSFLSAFFEFMGQNTSLASLSPYGGQALELAYRSIKNNQADVAMAIGCGNWITEVILYELGGLGVLSKCRSGIYSYRPFDKDRDGFITGEGGAAIFLEASDIAKQRGAEVFGRVKGFGNCMEFAAGDGLSVPPMITKRCIEMAISEAGCEIGDLAFINPHGSGTHKGDRSELRSIVNVLQNKKSDIPLCGLKPYTGHMGAASDIAEIIFGINAARSKTIPATLNFHKAEREFSDLRISNSHEECKKALFLSVSYGMGGQSSAVVINVT